MVPGREDDNIPIGRVQEDGQDWSITIFSIFPKFTIRQALSISFVSRKKVPSFASCRRAGAYNSPFKGYGGVKLEEVLKSPNILKGQL